MGTRVHSGADPGWHSPGPRAWTRPYLWVSLRPHDPGPPQPRRSGQRSPAPPLSGAVPASSQTTSWSRAPTLNSTLSRCWSSGQVSASGLAGGRLAHPTQARAAWVRPDSQEASRGASRGAGHTRQVCDSALGLRLATGPFTCNLPQGTQKSRKLTLLRGGGLRQLLPQESDLPGDGGAPQTTGPPFPGAREDWPLRPSGTAHKLLPSRPPPQAGRSCHGLKAHGTRWPGRARRHQGSVHLGSTLHPLPEQGGPPLPLSAPPLHPSFLARGLHGARERRCSQPARGRGATLPPGHAWSEAQGPRVTVRGTGSRHH